MDDSDLNSKMMLLNMWGVQNRFETSAAKPDKTKLNRRVIASFYLTQQMVIALAAAYLVFLGFIIKRMIMSLS